MAVIGAGSWGTALAIQCARAGHPTRLWGRDAALVESMRARAAQCALSCPMPSFPRPRGGGGLGRGARGRARCAGGRALACFSRDAARASNRDSTPTHASPGPARASRWRPAFLPHQVAREVFGSRPGAVLSGPTFAREVGAGLPTAMTIASRDARFAKELALRLSGPDFRAYTQSDIVGVEVGGAVKNVIAIGSGIADGMGFGANTRVALITRGLAEMTRLGVRLGAQRETFMGLAALGDLVLDLHRRSIAQSAPGARARPRAHRPRKRSGRSDRWSKASPPRPPCATSPSAWAWKCPSASRCIASCTRAGRCAPRCMRSWAERFARRPSDLGAAAPPPHRPKPS